MIDEYIKKDDAIKAVAEYISCDYSTEEMAIESATILIETIPTIDIPTWIPCSERLPEERGWYDCSTIDNRTIRQYWLPSKQRWVNNAVKHIFDIYNVMSITGERVFYKEDGPYDFNSLIIAWMPLPQPYKEKNDE